eukprot:scaffold1199_cov150-Skeletonema_dohrnii-CCMP3373.AAC.8
MFVVDQRGRHVILPEKGETSTKMGVSLIRLGNACVEGVGCRVWRGVEPPRVENYPIPIFANGQN